MKLRYAGECACGTRLAAGTRAAFDRTTKLVVCLGCHEASGVPPAKDGSDAAETERPGRRDESGLHGGLGSSTQGPTAAVDDAESTPGEAAGDAVDRGEAGASLQKEFERRKRAREERIRGDHKYLGGLILAVTDEPASTTAFAKGARGERELAARLERDCPDALFLYNRKLGRGRRDGDIDHLAVTASGVYVIDAKRYPGSTVRVQRSGGLHGPAKEKLTVNGRDRTALLAGCSKQTTAVLVALHGHDLAERVAVSAALCFIEADLPLLGTLRVGGVPLLGPKATVKLVRAAANAGGLDAEERARLYRHLAAQLPPA